MTDRIENQQGAERTETNAASNMLKEAMSSPKAWSGSQHSDTTGGANSKHNQNLPNVEIAAFGIIVAPGNPDKDAIQRLVEAAVDRVENMLDRRHQEKPGKPSELPHKPGEGAHGGGSFQISNDMLERFRDATPTSQEASGEVHSGSIGSIGYGEEFVLEEKNKVTDEMIENLKKAKPMDLPEFNMQDLRKVTGYSNEGTIEDGVPFNVDPKNQLTQEMIDRIQQGHAKPVPLLQVDLEDLKKIDTSIGMGTAQKPLGTAEKPKTKK